MIQPHTIRLRGGWTLENPASSDLWTLPCTGTDLKKLGDTITLSRRFNHPPQRSGTQICRLVLRHVAGVVEVNVDGQAFVPAMPVIDHPEAGFDFELPVTSAHRLILTVDTLSAAEAPEWGLIWLEIGEGSEQETPE
jgi:hypothetical protein